jgi:methionyl-tRNA formyltransferase
MRIDAGLDTGDMLLRRATPIHPDEAAPELGARLAAMGAELLIEGVRRIEQRTAVFEPQDNAAATLAPILKKEDGRVDWNASANVIYNRLRGFNPWPGSHSSFRGQQLRIYSARPLGNHATVPEAGTLIIDKRTLMVKCGEGDLELLEIQLEGKKRMSANVFLNGYIPKTGERLGE